MQFNHFTLRFMLALVLCSFAKSDQDKINSIFEDLGKDKVNLLTKFFKTRYESNAIPEPVTANRDTIKPAQSEPEILEDKGTQASDSVQPLPSNPDPISENSTNPNKAKHSNGNSTLINNSEESASADSNSSEDDSEAQEQSQDKEATEPSTADSLNQEIKQILTVLREPISPDEPKNHKSPQHSLTGSPEDLLRIQYESRDNQPPQRYPVEDSDESLSIFMKVRDLVMVDLLERRSLRSTKAIQAQKTIEKILSRSEKKGEHLESRKCP